MGQKKLHRKMEKNFSVYNAKILLFGEYTVIFNSKALTIPYTFFNGSLSFIGTDKYTRYDRAMKSNRYLHLYLDFFLKHEHLEDRCGLDLKKFRADLEKGLYFESNIPQGYGVGSSGALVAAIYEQYCPRPIPPDSIESILKLKEIFSIMESYFHGTSSGMDPLNCYVGEPLLFEGKDHVSKVQVPHSKNNAEGAVFLIDTGTSSATEPLVKHFLSRTQEEGFMQLVEKKLIPLTNNSIKKLLSGDLLRFFDLLAELSDFQYHHFREMIPERMVSLWRQGIETGEFYLKLCGSGGGGFLLGFTRNYAVAENLMKDVGMEIIPVFKNSSFKQH